MVVKGTANPTMKFTMSQALYESVWS